MPPKSRDPDRPTFYLDQSTLSDAFRSTFVEGARRSDPAYLPLRPWIERVAREANLCLSSTHVLELAAWSELEADAMAEWLDSLDIVWMRSYPDVQRAEDEYVVRVVAGVHDAEPTSPFAPSFLTSFEDLRSADLPGVLESPTIMAAVSGARARPPRGERELQKCAPG